ncbi:MAG: hypothetical protein RLZZ628_2230 [Bacteroidota bacterium]
MMKLKTLLALSLWLLTYQNHLFAQADLTITNVIAPSTGAVNENLDISFRFKNTGAGIAFFGTRSGPPVKITLISSANGVPELDLGLLLLFTTTRTHTLSSGYDSLIQLQMRLPYTLTAGNYTLRLHADPFNSIAETNETNNVVNIPLNVRAATTDNQHLKIVNVIGDHHAEPKGKLTTSITIKNSSHLPSAPDYLFLGKWVAVENSVPAQYYIRAFADNTIAYATNILVPSIPPNQTVTIPAIFNLPSTLTSDVLMKSDTSVHDFLEPYIQFGSMISDPAITQHLQTFESAKQLGYFFPITPVSTADLSLTGAALTPTWDSIQHTIELRLRVTNKGPKSAKNIVVELTKQAKEPFYYASASIGTKLSGDGTTSWHVSRTFYFNTWNIAELAPGASAEATFSGFVKAQYNQPQFIQAYYHDVKITPRIWYADVNDPVAANDTINGGITYKFVRIPSVTPLRPDLTLANLQLERTAIPQGQTLNYKVDIKNIGTGIVPPESYIWLTSYLSKDSTLTPDDIVIGGSAGGAINGMNITTIPQVAGTATPIGTLAAQQYYLIVQVTANNITEIKTYNNTIVLPFMLTDTSTRNDCASLRSQPWDLWLSKVQFNTLNNPSTQFKDPKTMGYSNYTTLSTSVAKGQRYDLNVTPSLSWIGNLQYVYCRAWIDFNNNKIFEENEIVLEQKNANPMISNVLIPSTAVSGNVQMRIALKWGSYPTACESFAKGEIEDYTLQIGNAVNSVADIALSATATPPTYQKYNTNKVKIIAQNNGNQAFTNVNIEFPFPAKTVTGGSIIPSIGSWKEWCTGGVHCFMWTIPNLAANSTATLEVPIFVLDATETIAATAKLLNSTLAPAVPTVTQARTDRATERVPILIKTLMPSPTEGDLIVELESFKSKEVRFDFYNMMGKVVKTETRTVERGNNQLLFEFWELASGMYFVQTSEGTGNNVPLKFVKW